MRGVLHSRFQVSRQSTFSDSSTVASFDKEDATLRERFACDETERRWREINLNENIQMGARTMIFWTLIMLVVRTVIYWAKPSCLASSHYLLLPRIIEYGFLTISLVPLLFCLKRPRADVYLLIVILNFIYLLAMNLPPFSYSCEDLFELVICDRDGFFGSRRVAAAQHVDCTLQGHTSQQMCMTWLLITPRIIPRLRMMHFVWIWIFVGYLGVTLWYRQTVTDKYFTDFDVKVSVWFLVFTHAIAINRKFYLEKSQRNKFRYDLEQKEASRKVYCILDYMVPEHVILPMLFNFGAVIAEPVETASILFIMICDFEEFAHSLTPAKLLGFLNDKFSAIDHLCSEHKAQKIETVGEEYVAAIGVVPADQKAIEDEGYPAVLGRLIAVVDEILRKHQEEDDIIGKQVIFKMGLHTGPIVAGVIGQKLPRFRLFGDTINTAARMMQKGLPGELQFGEETKGALPDWVKIKQRGEIEMKGKGKVMAYLFDKDTDVPKSRTSLSRSTRQAKTVGGNFNARKSLVDTLFLQKREAALAAENFDDDEESDEDENEGEIPRKSVSGDENPESERGPGASSASAARKPSVRQEMELSDLSNSQRTTPLLESPDVEAPPMPAPKKTKQVKIRLAESVAEIEATVQTVASLPSVHSELGSGNRVTTRYKGDEDKRHQDESVKFEKLLEEVKAKEMAERRPALSNLLHIFPDRTGFTEDMERKWFNWYHKETICKKLSARLDKQALFFSALFAIDTFLLVVSRQAEQPHEVYGESFRFPVFLLSRALSVIVMMSWRILAAASENGVDNWVLKSPREVQYRILASYVVIGFLMFISYDAMTVKQVKLQGNEDLREIEERILGDNGRESSIYSLWFVPIFFIIITSFQLLFAPSCCFIVLAGGLMLINYIPAYRGLYFSNQGKFLFLLNSVMNAYLARTAESTSRSRFKAKHVMELSQNRIETILNTLMPTMVVEELRELSQTADYLTHEYKRATIAQSDLCGFTKLASTRKPEEVVTFIGELFRLFDDLTDKYEIYKVETVGDAYIAGQAEAPLTSKNKPINVLCFGLDMVKATHEWSRNMGENVSCRVGVHSGECIGGIVGTEMQRYHLFGGLMRGLEVLESTAPEGRVQISQACKSFCETQMRKEDIPAEAIKFEARTDSCLQTSKGEKISYDEVGGGTYTVRVYSTWYSQLQKQEKDD